jgi:F-type H+-transporting ATPase subunit b
MRRSLLIAAAFTALVLPEAGSARAAEPPAEDTEIERDLDRAAQVAGEHADEQHAPGQDLPAEGEHGHAAAHHAPPPINWLDFGYKHKDVLGGSLEPGEEPMAPPFAMALLNFAIFAGLVVGFGGPKLTSYLRSRHDTIKRDLAEAARLRQEASDKLAEYSSRMAKVNSEVDQLIAEIRADADAEKGRILEDARLQAAALKKDAADRIASEIARARLELEREVVAAAVSAAERILRERTTPADQQAMFDGFVATLNRPAGGKPPTGAPGGGGAPTATPSARLDDDAVSKGGS